MPEYELLDEKILQKLKSRQLDLANQVTLKKLPDNCRYIAGFDLQRCNDMIIGCICYFDLNSHQIISHQIEVVSSQSLPGYRPGFLSLRELPLFLNLWVNRSIDPDLVVIDGNGLIHPRRCGFATELSFEINKPTFGIAKNLLLGKYDTLGTKRGDYEPIISEDDKVGVALRTQDKIKPIFVSVGNEITISECIKISLAFARYRIPELTRQPDIKARHYCRMKKND